MATRKQTSFQHALDVVEGLPDDQKQDLIGVVRRRLAESRRAEIAGNIRKAKAEHKSGKTRKGSLADLIGALRKRATGAEGHPPD